MYGNNIAASKFYRVRVPMFTPDESPDVAGIGNKKYFFPELPILDHACIVGIEAHLSTQSSNLGDITRNENGRENLTTDQAKAVLVTIYGADKTQSFASIPLVSLFPNNAGTYKRVNPYYGKINTRMSYCIFTFPNTDFLEARTYVNLTFYYNPKK